MVLHWYSSQQIKDNFNDFSNQVKGELKKFSQLANKIGEELQNIQKEIKGLNKTIEELDAIESELKNVTTSLAELNKTRENIKDSLDNVGELKEKIDELTKLEIPLIELEKSLIKGGKGLEQEIKEKIGGLVDQIQEFKKIVCPICFNWNFKINPLSSISNNIIEEGKWKELFKDGKLTISGKIETVVYSLSWRGWIRKLKKPAEAENVNIERKSEIREWKDKGEHKEVGVKEKEFILEKSCCNGCQRELNLKNFSIKKLREEI